MLINQRTHLWATLVRKFVAKNFQNSPNLVTLTSSQFNFKTSLVGNAFKGSPI